MYQHYLQGCISKDIFWNVAQFNILACHFDYVLLTAQMVKHSVEYLMKFKHA